MTNLQLIKKYQKECENTNQKRIDLNKEIDAIYQEIQNKKLTLDEKIEMTKAGTYGEWRENELMPLHKKHDDLLIEKDLQLKILKMQQYNMALAFGNYCAEKIINSNILEKYKNKAIGEKTKEKIENEIMKILKPLNVSSYLHFGAHYFDNKLYMYNRENNINVVIYGLYNTTEINKIESINNFTNIQFDYKGYKLPKTYYKNYEKTINTKRELKKKIEGKEKELRKLLDQYNITGINTQAYADWIKWNRL